MSLHFAFFEFSILPHGQNKLSNLLSREWVENKQETWDAGDFGKCKKEVLIYVMCYPRCDYRTRMYHFFYCNPGVRNTHYDNTVGVVPWRKSITCQI